MKTLTRGKWNYKITLTLSLVFLILVVSVFPVIAHSNKVGMEQFGIQSVEPSLRHRPYSEDSPWNTLIGPNPVVNPNSEAHIGMLEGLFGSDPNQYTMPLYEVDSNTPMKTVKLSGTFSNVTESGTNLTRQSHGSVQVPIPVGAAPAAGSDSQIIIVNVDTGDEWGFWKASENGDGSWSATNGYHYNINWNGVPPEGFVSRGAGVPYLAGLIRPWEIELGKIEHAIAFAYDYPTPEYVYPATKSDGKGRYPDMPEGTRLQIDPALTDADFDRWGLSESGKIIARALQDYGMIIIDNSGHPKIYAEYQGTAQWNGVIDPYTVSSIPYSSFRIIDALSESPNSTFVDVPQSHWAYDYIEALSSAGYIAGCNTNPPEYCPEKTMNRAESAVFVERGFHGAGYLPQQPNGTLFDDVSLGEWYAKWANGLWEDGYTAGCGTNPLIYCPLQPHARAEGAVFFLRMMYGADYQPPAPTGVFADVGLEWWYAKWVEAAWAAGIAEPCATSPDLRYCPDEPLTRAVGAYMMVKAKGLSIE
ncbi:MAG: hypothetical protein GTO18_21010 [Anaerolineales bacterium]|nr:hypothetical protein [Anaerolineales bacterium]